MPRARQAVVIIALSLIGAYSVRKRPPVAMSHAAAGLSAPSDEAGRGRLARSGGEAEDLRDAVGGYPIAVSTETRTTAYEPQPQPQRGSGEGGIEELPNDPGQNFSPQPVLSPSGPGPR